MNRLAWTVYLASLVCFVLGILLPFAWFVPAFYNATFELFLHAFRGAGLYPEQKSIVCGVVQLVMAKQWFPAAMILFCSLLFPCSKYVFLGLRMTGRGGAAHVESHSMMEVIALCFISMLDVQVLALLVLCFVEFEGGTRIEPGVGGWFYACSVALLVLFVVLSTRGQKTRGVA